MIVQGECKRKTIRGLVQYGMQAASKPNRYQTILQTLAADMAEVDRVLTSRLQSDVPLVRQVAQYIIQGGGKRMRPVLVILSARALFAHQQAHQRAQGSSGTVPSDAVADLAVIVEFIHTATLLHDDVVDESGMRRSRQTANAIFGNAASVLVGDFLYSRAFQMMVSINSLPVMAVLSEATNVIAEGEVLQLMNCQDPDVDEARYLQVIRFKTAKLFEASASLPAVLSGEAAALVEAFAAYGRHIGTAFQLTDDILDYSGDETEMGKQLGDDLREGKPTLPLIRLLSNGSASDQALIRTAIVQPESADIEAVIGRVRASDALAYAKGVAEQECRRAREALAPLADSEAKTSLLDLASFVLERQG
jgi:octaprenyl-diphosphate synthase